MSLESRILSVVQAIGADIKTLFGKTLPSMTGHAGKVLTTDGEASVWVAPSTSIDGGNSSTVFGPEDRVIDCGGA